MKKLLKKISGGLTAGAFIFAIFLLVSPLSGAEAQQTMANDREGSETVRDATLKIKEILQEGQIPPSVFQNAAGVAILPSVVKAALIAGGRYGDGVLLTHDNDQWSAPVFISITGGSIGAQIGATSTDLLLVFNNQSSIQRLIGENEFNLGVDAVVAAGPAGAGGKATTSDADIYAYRRSEGLFAGVSLTGGVLSIDQDKTLAYYTSARDENVRSYYGADKNRLIEDILDMKESQRIGQVPPEAQDLRNLFMQQR